MGLLRGEDVIVLNEIARDGRAVVARVQHVASKSIFAQKVGEDFKQV